MPSSGEPIDDWEYGGTQVELEGASSASSTTRTYGLSVSDMFGSAASVSSLGRSSGAGDMAAESQRLGYSVGGAKDSNAFRDDIANGYVPLPTDLTYEGLFYEYYFDTGEQMPCAELFCPSYATATAPDPISGETDYYLTVGLNSGMTEADFERKPLNLVIALDISGSMGSPFDEYYYDGKAATMNGEPQEDEMESKLKVAQDSLVALMDHLRPDDRLGIVLFDDAAVIAKPLRLVSETDMAGIERHVRELTPQQSTNMSAGMDLATTLFADVEDAGYENRVILLTDAQLNTGDLSESGLVGRVESNAEDGVYSTMIGIGVDFQTELVEAMTKTRGANYYSVHSPSEFKMRMDEGFDFMVTPLVFDLTLDVKSDGFDIEQVYGSPEANRTTGEVMYVNTLFPSPTNEGETKGGIVLLKLKRTEGNANLTLSASYEDRDGKRYENKSTVTFPDGAEQYDNAGIRKAVWLARYADILKDWMIDARAESHWWQAIDPEPLVNEEEGITVPTDVDSAMISRWEQTSVPLTVSEAYIEALTKFRDAFKAEVTAIGDATMERETEILDQLTLQRI